MKVYAGQLHALVGETARQVDPAQDRFGTHRADPRTLLINGEEVSLNKPA